LIPLKGKWIPLLQQKTALNSGTGSNSTNLGLSCAAACSLNMIYLSYMGKSSGFFSAGPISIKGF